MIPEKFDWKDIYNRLKSIGTTVPSGAACATIHILLLNGEPVQWHVPDVIRLEPRRAAQQFVDWLNDEAEGLEKAGGHRD